MTKRFYSVEGEILGDSEAGDYMRDALGSVTATCNPDTGSVWNTYRYKPYGSDLSSSGGEKPDPKFRWVGTAGYRQTSISHSSSYVRARHYAQEEGRWTTVDPLWPEEPTYGYCRSSPASAIDPKGLWTIRPLPCKGINGKQIFPEAGDISGIVGGPLKGASPRLVGGADCTKGFKDAQGRHCICVNGSFFGWNDGGTGSPVGPYKDCSGKTIDADERGLVQIITDHGYIFGFPSGHGNPTPTGRTGACVDAKGRIKFLIVVDISHGVGIGEFVRCLRSLCKSPNRIVVLDGSGSSQIWVGDPPAKSSPIYPGDRRTVINWIVICEKKAKR